MLRLVHHHSPVISGASHATQSHWPKPSQLRLLPPSALVPHQRGSSGALDRDCVRRASYLRSPHTHTHGPDVSKKRQRSRETLTIDDR